MTEKAIEFLQEWISEKIHPPHELASIGQEAEILARECARQAASAGVHLEDIEEEVGDLEELIATRLEDAVEARSHPESAPAVSQAETLKP